ncbi:PREDICTED: receptor like protein 30-like [Nelumbo nucifera]|uniref:Receptor like protein 30-like n=1 Tax=Nelumbo nucifera TaxID=4432 RepID=A0A1U8Q9J2_NELNU|nr:PREDICTED: receptor like protein 30-like [Nelumbo nucifera]
MGLSNSSSTSGGGGGCSTTSTSSLQLLCLVLFSGILYLETIKPCFSSQDVNLGCIELERMALLKLKHGLVDHSARLSSWVGEDCCSWGGVRCSYKTGHVVQLNLRNTFQLPDIPPDEDDDQLAVYERSALGGEINPSLLNLEFLTYMDFSNNNFSRIPIPSFIGSLKKLRYLNLSRSSFGGTIPPQLGNLSSLRHLDLSGNYELNVDNLEWLPGLSSLAYLHMGYMNMRAAGKYWLQSINMLPSLLELHLSSCELHYPLLPHSINLTSLSILDLSTNSLNTSVLIWFLNISSLSNLYFRSNYPQYHNLSNNLDIGGGASISWGCHLQSLDLSESGIGGEVTKLVDSLSRCNNRRIKTINLGYNQFSGRLPASIFNLSSLEELDLSGNLFYGNLPTSVGNLSCLKKLDLSYNQMNGTIPVNVGELSDLVFLDLCENSWNGVISKFHLMNLTRLETFLISSSSVKSLVFKVTYDWVPPFSLKLLDFSDLQLDPRFPTWLQTQKQLSLLSLRNVGISDTIPHWFWELFSNRQIILDLSNNHLTGKLPTPLRLHLESSINLSFNCLEGPIQPLSANLTALYLSSNFFSGAIPTDIGNLMPLLYVLDLSWNRLGGSIPPSITKMKQLETLILSNNLLSGELPRDWKDLQKLQVLDLANNSLTGMVPSSFSLLINLEWLVLSNNSFHGELPSLRSCKGLLGLNLGENRFYGEFLTWIGETSFDLMFLRLRSNSFSGNIPEQLCGFTCLHFLDLARNNLSGFIPSCFGNLSAFVDLNSYMCASGSSYRQSMMVVTKGKELQYTGDGFMDGNLDYIKSIDLSSNNLSGNVPDEITNLLGLQTLNLSMNHLTGKIPEKIGNLKRLETLDLSSNHLSGNIPQSLSSLSFLSHLNLSYNNLSGRIPSGNQLQTLDDSSIYTGNPYLCGLPLSKNCENGKTSQSPASRDGDNGDNETSESKMQWFYISMAPGFVVGFWLVCGSLLLKRSWRLAFFQLLGNLKDWILLKIELSIARLSKR